MSISITERRMVENEVVFRRHNEKVKVGFEKLRKIAEEDGQQHQIAEPNTPLYYLCECSDENCRLRIKMKPSIYDAIHKQRDRFSVIPGHETTKIEKIIEKQAGYTIVEKYITPPGADVAATLHPTDVENVW